MRLGDRIGRRLKLHDLHVLMAVAQVGSMSRAAALLNTGQSAVSRSIADLEHAVGVRLLDRNRRGVEPTEYGRALLGGGAAMFDDLRQAVKTIEFLAEGTAGEVRIGTTAPLAASVVCGVIDRLSRRYPRMVFHVVVGTSTAMQRELDERNVDLLILRKFGTADEERFGFERILDNPYVVAAGANHPVFRRRRLDLAGLAGEMWVLPPSSTRLGSLVAEIFRANGLDCPRASVVSFALEMTLNLLRTDRYLAILPESVLRFPAKHPFLKKVPLTLPTASGPVGILTLKNRTLNPAAQFFIDRARQIAGSIAKER